MRRLRIGLLRDESGATAIEYGLIAALIALVCVVAITTMGSGLGGLFNYTTNKATTIWDNASQ